MRKKNFTLIELIVVIAIIAVLAAIIAPNAFRAIEKAKIARTAADFKTVKSAVLQYYADTGEWTALSGGQAYVTATHPLLVNPGNVTGWDGPYLERVPMNALSKAVPAPWCSIPGYYYVYFRDPPDLEQYFDLNNDGINEISRGLSVCAYGFDSAEEMLKLDAMFDGQGKSGSGGYRSVYPTACNNKGIVALYVATM